MRLLVTRPRADAEALARQLAAAGHDCLIEPLLDIEPTGATIDLSGVQALAATSRHGVAAFARREARRDLPLYAVGEATAETARECGFATVVAAEGDAVSLARLLAQRLTGADGSLLHVSAETIAADLAPPLAATGVEVRRVALYRARAAERLSETCLSALAKRHLDGATFLSPRTATTFVRLVSAAGIAGEIQSLVAFCLSPAVAAALASLRWGRIETAAKPSLASLLETIASHERKRRGP